MIKKEIINWEAHGFEHPWLCRIYLEGGDAPNNASIASWEMVDWAIMFIWTDGDYYETFNVDWIYYELVPFIDMDKDLATWYLLWDKVYIWQNFLNPEN